MNEKMIFHTLDTCDFEIGDSVLVNVLVHEERYVVF